MEQASQLHVHQQHALTGSTGDERADIWADFCKSKSSVRWNSTISSVLLYHSIKVINYLFARGQVV